MKRLIIFIFTASLVFAASSVKVGVGSGKTKVGASSGVTKVEATAAPPPSSTPIISAVASLSGARNDFYGCGIRFIVQGTAITITELGRYKQSGNSATHALHIYRTSDMADMGGVTVDLSTGSDGTFVYATLSSPITGAVSTEYVLISDEAISGDLWYLSSTATVDPKIVVSNNVFVTGNTVSNGGTINNFSGTDQDAGPVNFKISP